MSNNLVQIYIKEVYTTNITYIIVDPRWSIIQFLHTINEGLTDYFNINNWELVEMGQHTEENIPSEEGTALFPIVNVTLLEKYSDKLLNEQLGFYIRPKSTENRLTCIICLDNERNILFNPCHHICCCNRCVNNLNNMCPVCRQEIQSRTRVYINP